MDSMRTVVESGGDTDTIGSMVGQIRGACFGLDDIPPIAEGMDDISMIREVAAEFAQAVRAMQPRHAVDRGGESDASRMRRRLPAAPTADAGR
jgi:hypothetical protein